MKNAGIVIPRERFFQNLTNYLKVNEKQNKDDTEDVYTGNNKVINVQGIIELNENLMNMKVY